MRSELTDLSLKRLTKLHPKIQQSALSCYEKCVSRNIPLYVVWANRSVEEQNLLYRLGRDVPGKIYTYTRGDMSPHCYGLALEFCLYNDDVFYEWSDCENKKYWRWMWIKVMKTFEKDGWTSGWRWYNFQPGYLENLMGKSIFYYKTEDDNRESWNIIL